MKPVPCACGHVPIVETDGPYAYVYCGNCYDPDEPGMMVASCRGLLDAVSKWNDEIEALAEMAR